MKFRKRMREVAQRKLAVGVVRCCAKRGGAAEADQQIRFERRARGSLRGLQRVQVRAACSPRRESLAALAAPRCVEIGGGLILRHECLTHVT
jgi:hypothetical protein